MPHFYNVTIRDFSNELSTAQFNIPPITVGTIVGELVNIALLRTAVDGITLGVVAADTIIMDKTVISAARPVVAFAQRENKWLVRYHGNTDNLKHTLEIPTPDLTNAAILLPGTDKADLTFPAMATFVTQFQGSVVSPNNDLQSVTIDEIIFVGRNL